jgi:hypothetical protein
VTGVRVFEEIFEKEEFAKKAFLNFRTSTTHVIIIFRLTWTDEGERTAAARSLICSKDDISLKNDDDVCSTVQVLELRNAF